MMHLMFFGGEAGAGGANDFMTSTISTSAFMDIKTKAIVGATNGFNSIDG